MNSPDKEISFMVYGEKKLFIRKFRWLLSLGIVIVVSALFSTNAFADSSLPAYTNNPVVAVVDGEPVMMDDLKNAQIHDFMSQLHLMQSRALKEKILQQLSRKHPELAEDTLPQVTEKDIIQFYETTPGVKDLGGLDKMREEIREYLERAIRESYIEEKYNLALEKKWVKVYLKPPSEFRVMADVGTAMLWFKDDPKKSRKVLLLEYSDFQCPFCKRVQETIRKLRKTYSAEVQFGYRHFPLPFHKEAKDLAEAVECARDQGRFWELQSLLYAMNSDTYIPTEKEILGLAKKAGVKEIDDFQTCVKERKYRSRVMDDIREGVQLGIQGTPTFILGLYDSENGTVSGEIFSGAVSQDKFVETIEKYLSLSRAEAKLARQPSR